VSVAPLSVRPARPPDLAAIVPFLPPPAVPHVERLLDGRRLAVRIVPPRRTKLGDHRPPRGPHEPHRISLNADLNPFAFLTTLLHEVAHAAAWERHGGRRRLRPHGPEWQREFGTILAPVVASGSLPADVAAALDRSLHRPAAATCSDRGLVLALARYDLPTPGQVRVEDLPDGAVFRAGRHAFRAAERLRTRRRCFECRTGREYRVHGLLVVETLAADEAAATSAGCHAGRRRSRGRLRLRG
jgi:SprT protein